MFSYDALDGIETQSGSLADSLGSEERLENVGLNFRGNAGTVVADLDNSAIILAKGSYSQLACSTHCVDGVVDDVGPDLVEFAAEGIHEERSFLIIPLHFHSPFEFVIQDSQRGLEGFHDIDVLQGRLIHERI